MARKGFASSIGSALEGRNLSPVSTEPKEGTKVEPKVNEPTPAPKEKREAKTKKVAENKAPKIEGTLTTIGFSITEEDSKFIRKAAIKTRMTKEEFFSMVFTETLSFDIDFDDPDYELFTERFKKAARYTTRIDKSLYEQMQEKAADNYLNITGYINYMIRKYRKRNEL